MQVVVGIGLVVAEINGLPKVLVSKRLDKQVLGGLWEFPGGKVEPGEDIKDCVVREIKEEVCLDVKVVEAVDPIVHTYPHATVQLCPFWCQVIAGVPMAQDVAEVRWVDVKQVQQLTFPEGNHELVRLVSWHLTGLAAKH